MVTRAACWAITTTIQLRSTLSPRRCEDGPEIVVHPSILIQLDQGGSERMRRLVHGFVVCAGLLLALPAATFAQTGTIAGTAQDDTRRGSAGSHR